MIVINSSKIRKWRSTYSFVKSFSEKTTYACFKAEYGLIGWCAQIQKAIVKSSVLVHCDRQLTLFDLENDQITRYYLIDNSKKGNKI